MPHLAGVDTVVPREDGETFDILADGKVVSTEPWDDMRYSVLWKAYCFKDEEERRVWREHLDDLDMATVLDTLMADMRRRGVIQDKLPENNHELAQMLIATYMTYVPPSETRKHMDAALASVA